jgi:hypothetical protein
MKDIWQKFSGDFNAMTDAEIDQELDQAQAKIDEETEFVEAVAVWKKAGKPRSNKGADQ